MTDREFADCLRKIKREKSEADVMRLGWERDKERGLYVPHSHIRYQCEASRH